MRARGILAAMLLTLAACAGAPLGPPAAFEEAPMWRSWQPEGPPRAVVLALHGFNDYSHGFELFGRWAAERGLLVHAYDQPGFGRSGDRGLWAGMPALAEEARRRAERLAAAHPDRPLFLLGESMGAAVALAVAAGAQPPPLTGVILSAPAVWGGDQLNPLYRVALRLASGLFPDLAVRATGDRFNVQASDNVEALLALGRDPVVIKTTRLAAIAGVVTLMDRALELAPQVELPLLALSGARDEVIPPRAFAAMRATLAARPCHAVVYPDGWHLLLRDLQREVVFEDILAWIDGRELPSGHAEPCDGRDGPALSSVDAGGPR